MLNEFVDAILKLTIFASLPFLFYVIKKRKAKGFLHFIGFKNSTHDANILAFLVSLLFAAPFIFLSITHPEFFDIIVATDTVQGNIKQIDSSVKSIGILLIAVIFKSSLSEEILFRGFFAKQFIAITGYKTGNIFHAVLYGIFQSALFMFISGSLFILLIIFLFTSLTAYCTVFMNEKVGNGSIFPGWIAHSLGNIIYYISIGFMM